VVDHALQSAPIEGVANEPKPNCVCMDLAGDGRDSMARYGARYWITDLRIDDPTNSRVRARIVAALRRAEIPLAVPTSHVSLEKDTESRRQRKRERELKRSREALTTLPFLAACSEEELDELAEHIDHVPFEAGEVVTSQGAVAHFLYIIVRGTAEVRVYQGTEYEAVNVVKGPTYVGEMGLMTGAPRGATVVAVTDLDCFRLDKQAFGHVLEAHPEMVEAISDLLSKRTAALKAARTELAGEQAPPEENRRIGAAIRRFFGLDGG
ncbi:MAG: cyclic nucleotide-binding domain-containing protein, partial [Myxococcales bacterium]|nr:cyclic nucleotide-binding domain-containing protein [Myxococcales bacterium]